MGSIGPSQRRFVDQLDELNRAAGRDVTIVYRFADGRPERLPALAAELLDEKVDVIVTAGPQAIRAVKEATARIPIVMAIVGDPVAAGLVKNLARPDANLTGLSMLNAELSGKRLQLLKEIAPGMTRIAVLADPTLARDGLAEIESTAGFLGVELRVVEVGGSDIEAAFEAARHASAHGVVVMPTPFSTYRRSGRDLPISRYDIGCPAYTRRPPSCATAG